MSRCPHCKKPFPKFDTIGERVTFLREQFNLSRTKLAKICGLTPPVITRVEQNDVLPSIPTLESLADVLETTTDWLLGR